MKTKKQWEVQNNYAKYVAQENQLDKVRAAKKVLNDELRKLYYTKHKFVVKQKKTLSIDHNFFDIKIDNSDGHTIAIV